MVIGWGLCLTWLPWPIDSFDSFSVSDFVEGNENILLTKAFKIMSFHMISGILLFTMYFPIVKQFFSFLKQFIWIKFFVLPFQFVLVHFWIKSFIWDKLKHFQICFTYTYTFLWVVFYWFHGLKYQVLFQRLHSKTLLSHFHLYGIIFLFFFVF